MMEIIINNITLYTLKLLGEENLEVLSSHVQKMTTMRCDGGVVQHHVGIILQYTNVSDQHPVCLKQH